MTTAITLLVLLAAILVFVVFAGIFLPASWTVEKAELIHAQPADIYQLIASLEEWERWTVWDSKAPDLTVEYTDKKAGEGATQVWKSNRINGVLTIHKTITNQQVEYTFQIEEGQLLIRGIIALAIADTEYTQVAWRWELERLRDLNPVRRYQAFFLKNYLEQAVQDSLLSLQSIFEK